MRDIRMIVGAHYFCIIPLHDNPAHQKRYLEMSQILLDGGARL